MSEPEISAPPTPTESDSPLWSRTTKIFVAVATIILVVAFALRFQDLLLQIVAAGIIAYVVSPLINGLAEYTPLKRGASILIIYLVVTVLLVIGLIALGTTVFRQAQNLINSLPRLIDQVVEWISATTSVQLGPFTLDVASLRETFQQGALGDNLFPSVGDIVNQTSRTIVALIGSTVQLATTVIFTIIISVYMVFELPKLSGYVVRAAQQPGYGQDATRLTTDFGNIWRAYLRGQILLGLIIGGAVWLSLSILGVRNAFALGVLSGLLEFLPVIGPFIGTVAAATAALLQGTNPFGISTVTYILLIIAVMIIIQQIENNLLVPRIVGGALDLHPLIVIVGVFVGSTLAGLIGAILAAPVLATVKLVGTYAWRKMFDLPPFPRTENKARPRGPNLFGRLFFWRKGN